MPFNNFANNWKKGYRSIVSRIVTGTSLRDREGTLRQTSFHSLGNVLIVSDRLNNVFKLNAIAWAVIPNIAESPLLKKEGH